MAILEVMENGHGHVTDLRHELGRVREALDRTDAVLGVTDEALVRAEHAIETGRRIAPVVMVAVGVAVVAVAAVVVLRARRRGDEQAD
jgi:hypothetical protein